MPIEQKSIDGSYQESSNFLRAIMDNCERIVLEAPGLAQERRDLKRALADADLQCALLEAEYGVSNNSVRPATSVVDYSFRAVSRRSTTFEPTK